MFMLVLTNYFSILKDVKQKVSDIVFNEWKSKMDKVSVVHVCAHLYSVHLNVYTDGGWMWVDRDYNNGMELIL